MADADVVSVTIDRSRHTVLVVDDNPATRYSTGRMLRAAGFRTVEAATGDEAVHMAQESVSAVVLDVHLPDIDGFEVCRRLRAMPRTAVVPIIHLSATYVEDRHKVEGLDSGADAYITHPAEPPILVATVQALVRARMAEEGLRRSEHKFRAIYEQAESGIALVDGEGRFTEANPAMLRMLGRQSVEVLGHRIGEFAAPEWSSFVVNRLERASPGTDLRREVFSARMPAGDEVHLEWSMSPPLEDGQRVCVVSNVSDRLRLERQRQMLLEREQAARVVAERHSQTKDDFIAVLSHELRNPLNAMLMAVHVLSLRSPSPEVSKVVGTIEKNAKAQARIISDILDVSRINSGKLTLSREAIDPAALVAASVESLKPITGEKRLRVELQLPQEARPVWLDPTRFQQIFWNIFNNAVKFSDAGGRITVSMARSGGQLVLAVRDEGQGIAPEFIGTVFDKFAQGAAPGSRTQGGLGLGLSIVKHLAELHGGSVEVRSAGLGAGTTVTVRLPLVEPAAVGAAREFTETGPESVDAVHDVSVLVVEDDAQAREMLCMILRDRGAIVQSAGDYERALRRLDAERPDVLVSDIGLPGRDGYDLIREVRRRESAAAAQAPHAPVAPLKAIALTAFGRPEDHAMALVAGFDAHLAKPLQPHRLVAAIARLLRGE